MFIFRIIPFILILKYFVNPTYSQTTFNKTEVHVNESIATAKASRANTTTRLEDVIQKNTATIIDEGGERISTEVPAINTKTVTHGTTINLPTPTPIIRGREGVDNRVSVNINDTRKQNDAINGTMQNNRAKFERVKPVSENAIQTEDKSSIIRSGSVPRKGVNFTKDQLNNTKTSVPTVVAITPLTERPITIATSTTRTTTTTTTTTTTEKPSINKASTIQSTPIVKQVHKPTITTGSESDKDALTKQKSNSSTPKVPTIEYYQKNKEENKRSTFLIPIIAVILSVPLVAILLNILYKHGKEWWSHRHYRRMDFLIDGMYNN